MTLLGLECPPAPPKRLLCTELCPVLSLMKVAFRGRAVGGACALWPHPLRRRGDVTSDPCDSTRMRYELHRCKLVISVNLL